MVTPSEDLIPDGGLEALAALSAPGPGDPSTGARFRVVVHDPNELRLERLLAAEREVLGTKTPFLGRRAALETVYNAVRDAVTERHLRILHVVGAPGAGKTRLLAETFAIIDPVERGIDVLPVACSPDDDGATSMIAQLVRRRFGFHAGERELVARDRILEGVEPLVEPRSVNAVARMLGFLAGLRASGPSADTPPADLALFRKSALRQLVQVMASDLARAPQILIVHQAQHLGARSAELLSAMAAELADTPLVIVFVGTRPTPHGFEPGGASETRVDVGPLDDREIERLVRVVLNRVEPLPDALVEALVARAGGSPRLAEENVRILLQRGLIERRGDHWTVTSDAAALAEALAADLADASERRVAALTDEARSVLEVASVFGFSFSVDGVAAVLRAERAGAPGGEREVPWITDRLREQVVAVLKTQEDLGLVTAAGDGGERSVSDHSFVHERDRDAIFASIAGERRARIHAFVAQWLSQLELHEPAQWFEAIANHWEAGGRASAAARLLMRAAENAAEGYNMRRARAFYRRALGLIGLDRSALLVDCLAGLGELGLRSGEHTLARTAFGAMLEATLITGDVRLGATAWLKLAKAHRGLGDYVRARPCLHHATELYRRVNDIRGVAAALDQLAKVEWLEGGLGGYDDALDCAERSLEMRRRLGKPRPVAESLGTLANIRIQRGELDRAKDLLGEALELRRQIGDPQGEATIRVGLGAVHFATGDLSGALSLWKDGLELAEIAGDRDLIGAFLNNIGETYLELGDLPRAEAALVEAEELTVEIGDQRTALDVVRNLAALACEREDYAAALAHVARALDIGNAIGARPAVAQVKRTWGTILSRRGDAPEEATARFDEAVRVFVEAGDQMELARTVTAYADHLRRCGEDARADEVLALARGGDA
ncbi:MAG: tetratricopeptide repeat protein [Deltaproteobacteria bacterium]|nr:MAG: tetratricopeptide repeat protein [Deltaproteobacteria bacterium]